MLRNKDESEINNSVLGLDLPKNNFHLYTVVEDKPVEKKLKSAELLIYFANNPVSLIGREACGNAHHWGKS
ncbi:MAG: hypothetical protein GQ529_11035 [Methyloprofundus sp.]|nr:hypothetical protein [Methyloprofundus sp.]